MRETRPWSPGPVQWLEPGLVPPRTAAQALPGPEPRGPEPRRQGERLPAPVPPVEPEPPRIRGLDRCRARISRGATARHCGDGNYSYY